MDENITDSSNRRLPTAFVPVGKKVMRRGVWVTPVVRPRILHPSQACVGCCFLSTPCPHLQCSRWDRRDGLDVWFVKTSPDV